VLAIFHFNIYLTRRHHHYHYNRKLLSRVQYVSPVNFRNGGNGRNVCKESLPSQLSVICEHSKTKKSSLGPGQIFVTVFCNDDDDDEHILP
jgi:hypothetical protein